MNILKEVDFLSGGYYLNLKGKKVNKTSFGGLVSIIVLIAIIAQVGKLTQRMFVYQNPVITSYTVN